MELGDGVAVYGALVATILAFIQIYEWKLRRKVFSISQIEGPIPGEQMEFIITSTAQHPTEISFVGVGYTFRPWTKPWIRKPAEIVGLRKISEGYLKKEQIGCVRLMPGDFLEGHVKEKDWLETDLSNTSFKGFRFKYSVYIDHTLNEDPYIKVIK